jgi:hypothetical protein
MLEDTILDLIFVKEGTTSIRKIGSISNPKICSRLPKRLLSIRSVKNRKDTVQVN